MSMRTILFTVIALVLTNSFMLTKAKPKDFAFDEGTYTEIKGNPISSFLHGGNQWRPSYVFKHTRVVEYSKDKKLTQVGTLGSFRKIYKLARGKKTIVDRFEKYTAMNNAIYCGDIEQKLNYYDELEDVGAIVYGTRNVEDCALLREYIAQQKAAEAETK
ncbi:MAG TPA: hypothetical protein VKU36_04860 [Candidatus Babeliales bacterium]|nr:hypothetical protein [Candidatus Babeliales bacterium]